MKTLIYILVTGLSLAVANAQTQTIEEEKSNAIETRHKEKVEHVEKNQVTSPVERDKRVQEKNDITVQAKPEIKQESKTSEKKRVRASINEPRFSKFFLNGHYRFRSERHDHIWWRTNYAKLMLIEGCWYFKDDGCWFPAYGYDPNCEYPSDDPICD